MRWASGSARWPIVPIFTYGGMSYWEIAGVG